MIGCINLHTKTFSRNYTKEYQKTNKLSVTCCYFNLPKGWVTAVWKWHDHVLSSKYSNNLFEILTTTKVRKSCKISALYL